MDGEELQRLCISSPIMSAVRAATLSFLIKVPLRLADVDATISIAWTASFSLIVRSTVSRSFIPNANSSSSGIRFCFFFFMIVEVKDGLPEPVAVSSLDWSEFDLLGDANTRFLFWVWVAELDPDFLMSFLGSDADLSLSSSMSVSETAVSLFSSSVVISLTVPRVRGRDTILA